MAIVKKLGKNGKTFKPAGILTRIKPLSMPTDGIKMCVYGTSGSGKTTIGATFPKPLLFVKFEEGTASIHNVKGVDAVPEPGSVITDVSDFDAILNHLEKSDHYKTVVLDSASSLQDCVLKKVIDRDLPAQLDFGSIERDEWGQCSQIMKEFLNKLLKLRMNVVILAHEREFNVDDEKDTLEPHVAPGVSPAVKDFLLREVHYIGHTCVRMCDVKGVKKIKKGGKVKEVPVTREEIKYIMRVAPHPTFRTKFRVPKGYQKPEFIMDPDFDQIIRIIEGK